MQPENDWWPGFLKAEHTAGRDVASKEQNGNHDGNPFRSA
jgi:hypothetical protein